MDTVAVPAQTAQRMRGTGPELYWLPDAAGGPARMRALDSEPDAERCWPEMVALAETRLDFVRTGRLDRALRRRFAEAPPAGIATRPVRLAVLASSTVSHLLPSIRVGAMRRDLWVATYEAEYGQYFHELSDPDSALHAFRPDAVLFAFDAPHLTRGLDAGADAAGAAAFEAQTVAHLRACWAMARRICRGPILQQTLLDVFPPMLGGNEHRLPGSRRRMVARLNAALRVEADSVGVDLLAVDDWVEAHGLAVWHDSLMWHRAKQEVSPVAAPFYGDLVGRLLAAHQGRSRKCLVLDLDNTLWSGVIGDDGLEGIVLGQGSAEGEAFLVLQAYALEQARRGVILAVCSKNDEANALAPFDEHPEMLLKRADLACFVANWDDKARNIREIAQRLNIGLDSLVFVDDNPFERNLVRQELPMVAVPELPEEPALYARCLAEAGYFEGIGVTEEDRGRTQLYQGNVARESFQAQASDLESYLRGLEMRLVWRRFDRIGLARTVQLINKTNQFNLTSRRYTEAEVEAVAADPCAFGLQLRLIDRFGDNGIIAIVIGRADSAGTVLIDTWLMSCRVLGRGVEQATLNLAAEEAKRLGGRALIGEYRPTSKNGMVRTHYQKLGFDAVPSTHSGITSWACNLDAFVRFDTFIDIAEG